MSQAGAAVPADNFRLRPIDIEHDAEKLAQMWNASDAEWPGTWTDGVPMTAASARAWHESQQCIAALVWDTGAAIAGYCSLWKDPDEADVYYIAFVNVAPAFQGRSLARQFLVTMTRRVSELGGRRLDLRTWSGNLKAIPLYKKCGFCWQPGTSVQMLNYMPAILALPAAQPFFMRHDWYATLQRPLTQTADDERWEGMAVYSYHFRAGAEELTVRIDREAQTVAALETPAFAAAVIAADQQPPRGLPTPLRWRLTNHGAHPIATTLLATGTTELQIDRREQLALAPGEVYELTGAVAVAATAQPGNPGLAAPAIRSLLVLGDTVVELATGMRPRAAVTVESVPQYITLTPGVAQQVRLQLRSNLPHAVAAHLTLTAAPGLQADWTAHQVTLDPQGDCSLPLTLQAPASGVFELAIALHLEYSGTTIILPATVEQVFVLPPGGVLAASDGESVRIENETTRVLVQRKGAGLEIFTRAEHTRLAGHNGYVAPPIWPSAFMNSDFTLHTVEQAGQIVVTATATVAELPAIVFQRQISCGAGPVIRIDHAVENRGSDPHELFIYQWLSTDTAAGDLTLPLPTGVTHGPWDDFPAIVDDKTRQASYYPERWGAVELQETTLGVVWPADVAEVLHGWTHFQGRRRHCPAQKRTEFEPFFFYCDARNWLQVQRFYRRLSGGATSPSGNAQQPLTVQSVPTPVAIGAGTALVDLLVEHRRARSVSGTLRLELPAGWQSDATEFAFANVNWYTPYRAAVTVSASVAPGAYSGRIALHSREQDCAYELPLIRLGDGSDVSIQTAHIADQTMFIVDNGRLVIDITPDFGGTISGLRVAGVNQLHSPFPEQGIFGWMSPWYGGLTPILQLTGDRDFPGRLQAEQFGAAAIEWTDRQGIVWHGVRQHATMQRPELRGLELEIDALTVGGSPLLRLVLRLVNRVERTWQIDTAGWLCFVQPDGEPAQNTVWGSNKQFKASDLVIWHVLGNWGAAENPLTGRSLALVSPVPQVRLVSWGSAGNHMGLLDRLVVPPGASVELVGYLALASDRAEARRYAALAQLD